MPWLVGSLRTLTSRDLVVVPVAPVTNMSRVAIWFPGLPVGVYRRLGHIWVKEAVTVSTVLYSLAERGTPVWNSGQQIDLGRIVPVNEFLFKPSNQIPLPEQFRLLYFTP